jgi:multimeric flavodoxin WrbA
MTSRVLALVCTLKPSPQPSSAARLAELLLEPFAKEGWETATRRIVDHEVKPGTATDEGDGDAWPALRAEVDAADVLLLVTPIWNGQPASPYVQVAERLNAVLSEKDDRQRTPLFGKVGVIGVVGNEDGARHVGGIGMAALSELGLTFAAVPLAYYLGEDLVEQDEVPDSVAEMVARSASNAMHLSGLLKAQAYPGV